MRISRYGTMSQMYAPCAITPAPVSTSSVRPKGWLSNVTSALVNPPAYSGDAVRPARHKKHAVIAATTARARNPYHAQALTTAPLVPLRSGAAN